MPMTPDERLNYLDALGFNVARRPFREAIHYMRLRLPDGVPITRESLHGNQYSVDISNGRWNRWGCDRDGQWHPLDELLQSPAAAAVAFDAREQMTFVEHCLAHGFTLDDRLDRSNVDFGNRFARFAGRRYLLVEWTRTIVDCRFNAVTLDAFLMRASGTSMAPDPASAPPRPFVSMQERPIIMSGRTVQLSLF